jgi:hypothetical protein
MTAVTITDCKSMVDYPFESTQVLELYWISRCRLSLQLRDKLSSKLGSPLTLSIVIPTYNEAEISIQSETYGLLNKMLKMSTKSSSHLTFTSDPRY